MGLTVKQQRFCDEYLLDPNATQAAIKAGYSQKTAEKIGSENLKKPEIATYLNAARTERSEKTKIDAEWLLTRLAEEATADVKDIYDLDGNLLPVDQWPLIWRQGLIAGIDTEIIEHDGVKMGEIKKVRISDRLGRLNLIGKHVSVQAFQENVNHKGIDNLADRLAKAAQLEAARADE